MSRLRHTAADEAHFIIRTLASEARPGQAIEPHRHPWHQLIYASTGVTTVWTDQGSWVAPPSWAIWAPAGAEHGMRFAGHAALRTLYLRPEHWPDLPRACAVVAVTPLLRELILHAAAIGMIDERDAAHRALATLIIDSLRMHATPGFELPAPQSPALKSIAEALSDSDASAAAIARQHGLSTRTLERRFLAETGASLGRWRKQARMLRALQTLAGGASVKAAAHDAGYASPSAFVAAFKQSFGQTPARYLNLETQPI